MRQPARKTSRRTSRAVPAAKAGATPDPVNRATRIRLRTRQKLIEAAQIVMGRHGVDGTAIAQITEQADVGFGSFYNHFESKEQIALQVFAARAEELAHELERVAEQVTDAALAASIIQRWFIERAKRDPVWGWFIVHADMALQQVEATFRERAKRDIQRGIAAGRFSVGGLDTVVTITLSAIMAVMRQQLEGRAKSDADSEMTEALLCMYGLPADEAQRLAYQPLPKWLGK